MVDNGQMNDQRSTTHTELLAKLQQRDSGAEHQLIMLEHMKQQQLSYIEQLAGGYSANDLKSAENLNWLISDVAWRVEQGSTAVHYYILVPSRLVCHPVYTYVH